MCACITLESMKTHTKTEIKPVAKYKTEWNLRLLYKNEKDPRIEADLKTIEKLCAKFERKYKKANFTATPEKLAKALKDYEIVEQELNKSRPWWYFGMRNVINTKDAIAGAHATKNAQRITHATNKVAFFDLRMAKIPKKLHKQFLSTPILAPYRYELTRIFKHAEFNLSEGEEQVIGLLAQTSYTMWLNGEEKLLGDQVIEHGGRKLPFSEAISMYPELPKKERHELYKKITELTKSIAYFAENEINAVYNFKKVLDERRKYKKPYSETAIAYENDEKTIETLVGLVTKKFSISKRFYKLHAKLLKEKKILYADKSAKIGEIQKKFDFGTAVDIVRGTFATVDQKYTDILDGFLTNGQIDVYPKVGKQGGAFCAGRGDDPTWILLNHTDDIRSVETLAHEMGHGIHTELSKTQPPQYQNYTTSVAEVASTFFEQVVTDELENYLSKDERIILLHNKIKGDIATIFRQVACFNFELELHNQIRVKGEVSKGDMADMMAKHMRAYLGDVVEVTDDDGYVFVHWPHIRYFFYVYSYAYGQLISRALFENWKRDKSYAKKIEQFLSAGSSMSPEDIFKKIGIDTSDPKFFETGLKSIEKDIARLEKLTEQRVIASECGLHLQRLECGDAVGDWWVSCEKIVPPRGALAFERCVEPHVGGRVFCASHRSRVKSDFLQSRNQAFGIARQKYAGGICQHFASAGDGQLDEKRADRCKDGEDDADDKKHFLGFVVATATTAESADIAEENRTQKYICGKGHDAGENCRHGRNEDVTVFDMRQFVGEHTSQLVFVESL